MIFESVTAMTSTVALPDVFLMVMLPLSRSTTSLKVSTMLEPSATPVALSAGDEEASVGATESADVKLRIVLVLNPA